MPSTLPASLTKPPDPEIKDLPIGEIAWIPPTAMDVLPDGTCWIRPKTKYQSARDRIYSLKVSRSAAGYEVVVTSDWKWTPSANNDWVKGYIKVVDISAGIIQDDL